MINEVILRNEINTLKFITNTYIVQAAAAAVSANQHKLSDSAAAADCKSCFNPPSAAAGLS